MNATLSVFKERGFKECEATGDRQNEYARGWAIVLAGGEGERMRPLVESWLGSPRPKQFCRFVGNRCMLAHTLDRIRPLIAPSRLLTVICRGHETFLSEEIPDCFHGRVICQPSNRGTAVGIFLPAAFVQARDPGATLFILPSDHFIFPQERFLHYLEAAGRLLALHPKKVVLLAAKPDRPERDYGWIEAGDKFPGTNPDGEAVHLVSRFCEKPPQEQASDFYRRGFSWNTLIMVVKAGTLWEIGWQLTPELIQRLEEIRFMAERLTPGREERLFQKVFANLTPSDFSTGILEKIAARILVLEMKDVVWNDWGRPERVVESLKKIGKRPHFLAGRAAGAEGICAPA